MSCVLLYGMLQNVSSAFASGANNAYTSGTPGGLDDMGAGPMVQTWILMEYCDRGCLQVRNTEERKPFPCYVRRSCLTRWWPDRRAVSSQRTRRKLLHYQAAVCPVVNTLVNHLVPINIAPRRRPSTAAGCAPSAPPSAAAPTCRPWWPRRARWPPPWPTCTSPTWCTEVRGG